MPETTTERALVERLRAGDGAAVSDLSDHYGSKIFRLAFRYMKNHEDAEEITQDVLLRVYQKIDAFRGDAALSSWVYRITFNMAMSRLRSSKADMTAERQDPLATPIDQDVPGPNPRDEVPDWSSLADDQLLRAEMRRKLIGALRQPTAHLSSARPATGCAGLLDRRSCGRAPREVANTKIAAPSRSFGTEGSARRLRHWAGDATERLSAT